MAIEEQIPVRETTARLRYVSVSPPKMRLVLELIRGQDVETARDTLRFCDRSAAGTIAKLLDSAGRERRAQRRDPRGEALHRPRLRGRGPHPEAVAAPGPGPGGPDPQADQPRHARRRPLRRGRPRAAPPFRGGRARERRRLARRRPGRALEAGPDAAAEEPVDVDELPEGVDAEDSAAETAPAPATKRTAKKTPAKKTPAKKATAEKAPAKKTPAKKSTGEPAKKSTAKKTTATKTTATKTTAKKSPAKRARKTTEDED